MGRKASPLKYNPNVSDEIILKIVNGEPLTCEETAEALCMTKMNVSIIERKALAKLRVALTKLGISDLDAVGLFEHGRNREYAKFGGAVAEAE